MKTVKINKTKYVLGDTILREAPVFSRGSRNTRNLVKNKNIPKKDYMFARLNQETGEWEESDGKSVKYDKIVIKETYLVNIPELNDEDAEILDDAGVMKAPDIIELKEEEKFKDDEDNILEIETRGTRKCDDIYFKVKDVEKEFEMKSLYTTIIGKKNRYNNGQDYVFFIVKNLSTGQKKVNKKNNSVTMKKELFLTYEGIIRLLYVSKSGKAYRFIKWATNTLFTAQMGTVEQKQELAAGLIGVPVQSLKDVLSKSVSNISCVYEFVLGVCKDLRKVMKIPKDIPDNYLIIKYGFTDNLIRRTNDHIRNYGSIKGVQLELLNFAYIDPTHISNAESEVKEFFEDIETFIDYKSHVELVAINPKHNKQIKKFYRHIKDEFGGCVKELNEKIEELKRECEKKDLEVENMKKIHRLELEKERNEKENIIALKDKENERHVIEIEKHMIEIEKYKMEIENKELKLQLQLMKSKNKR